MSLLVKALLFATKAHEGVFRKWTGEPYVAHCSRVGGSLAAVGFDSDVVAAGLLHDVIEDCPISPAELAREFSDRIAALVVEVSKPKIPKTPDNKEERRAAMRLHLASSSYAGASIKLADMIDNSSNIAVLAPAFAGGYLAEMRKILPVLRHGHPELFAKLEANLAC